MARRRRRGEGSVFYSKTERGWVGVVSLGTVQGRRIRHRVRARTEAEAKRRLDDLLRAYGSGGDPATMTLDAYLTDWLAGHGPSVRDATRVSYAGHIDLHISPLLGGILVAKLRPSDVRRLIADRLAAGLSPSTVGRIVTTLRIALGAAVRERSLPDNVASIRLPRVDREPVRPLTDAEARRIMVAVRGDELEALYLLLLGSGLRLGEAVALDWRDVDLDRLRVHVRHGKTRRSVRTAPLPAWVGVALRAHRARSARVGPGEPVFLGPRSYERLTTSTASHAFPRLLERHHLRRMRVHDLRHGTASLMLAQGVHMQAIADQLGHANPALTAKVYAHVAEAQQEAAVRTLDRLADEA